MGTTELNLSGCTMPKIEAELFSGTMLNLYGKQLSDLPSEVSALSSLKHVSLGSNRLYKVPACIFSLNNLTKLDLNCNMIANLPRHLGALTNLRALDMYRNCISSLPDEISNLTSLSILGLGSNQLSTLPSGFSLLASLESLSLHNNKLTRFPEPLCKLTHITSFSLYGNEVEVLPDEISRFTRLETLNISAFGVGSIVRGPLAMTSLPCWDSSGNSTWEQASVLESLTLYDRVFAHNNLEGTVINPFSLTDFCSLDFSFNKIRTIPSSFTLLTVLTSLCLAKNSLTSFPCVLYEMDWLQALDVTCNYIQALEYH